MPMNLCDARGHHIGQRRASQCEPQRSVWRSSQSCCCRQRPLRKLADRHRPRRVGRRAARRHRRGVEPGAHREDAYGRDRRHRASTASSICAPGTYSLTVHADAASPPSSATNIELSGTQTLTIPIEMRVGGVAETITVTGETPVVDVQSAQARSRHEHGDHPGAAGGARRGRAAQRDARPDRSTPTVRRCRRR